jgi:hypothetical protein
MSQVGSTKDIVSQSITGVSDDLGNSIVSSSTGFGDSPLGVSAVAQALYGIANPNFNLLPPDPDAPIEEESNSLPFWSIDNQSDGEMTATSVFDDTTLTYGIELNPGTAAIDSTLTLTTRSYLLTDDNLALRQRALSVLSKSGTAGGTASEWNLQLSAIYYDANDTALSTAVIGTALDTGTWTSISGTTTPGGSAINSSARYVDLAFTMTATAAVTGSAKATIKSLILATSTPGGGGAQSFVITEAITSSQTWSVPTGVSTLLAVVGVGGGGGGGGGSNVIVRAGSNAPTTGRANSGGGGGGARWAILRDLAIGTAASVTVGIGAGGAGGTAAAAVSKAGGVTSSSVIAAGGAAGNGGSTTFGTYLTVPGGRGGNGGVANSGGTSIPGGTAGTGAAGTTATSSVYGLEQLTASIGGGTTSQLGLYTQLPFTPAPAIGADGGAGSTSGAGGTAGTGTNLAGTLATYGGGGGGSNNSVGYAQLGNGVVNFDDSFRATNSGGGPGGLVFEVVVGTATVDATAGNGGTPGANSGSGGGGGGGAIVGTILTSSAGTARYNASTLSATAGAGAAGADGVVYVIYVA